MTKVTYSNLRRTVLLSTLLLIFAMSCNIESKPSDLISKNKMSDILKDVHMAESSIQTMNASHRDSIARLYYGHIFRIHEVKEDEYYKSLEYYTRSPKELEEIYIEVEAKLNSKKSK